MVDFDDLDKTFNAQNVKLTIANTIGAGQVDYQDVIAVHKVTEFVDNPITRKNTRGGPKDFYTFAIIEYEITTLTTKKVRDRIRSLSKQSTRSVLQTQSFQVKGENLGGIAGNDTTIPFDATVPRYSSIALESGEWALTFRIRIDNATFT